MRLTQAEESDAIKRRGQHRMHEAAGSTIQPTVLQETFFFLCK